MRAIPIRRVALTAVGLLITVILLAAAWAYWQLRLSLPTLEGRIAAAQLSAPVTVARDRQGVPTIAGKDRADVAWALGFLHGQERFFQMDGQRRTAAGELSDLAGPVALGIDRRHRVHRFRSRARDAVAALAPHERKVLEAYAAGVNGGLAALKSVPFEYLVLRAAPEPWTAEDTVLTVYAMYLTLQEPDGATERSRANVNHALGPALTNFLFPQGTSWDAPLDGSRLPLPEIPASGVKKAKAPAIAPGMEPVEPLTTGSNGFAVGGQLTARGGAILANDLHLGLRVPNIWYRARLIVNSGTGNPELDITGITLPGAPTIVAGSNGRLAWGFTNSYVDTSDVVILEPADGNPVRYRTPDGPKDLRSLEEKLCRKCPQPEVMTVEESVWGPVIGIDPRGRKLAYRWIAHDTVAAGLGASLELERAERVHEALAIGHRLRIPHQNLVAADASGNVGWTVTTALPRRFGHDGAEPVSWADGTAGWDGYLGPDEVPVVLNPERHRIWTANARVVGGEPLRKLGFGGYAHGSRAARIRDRLFAQEKFSERDLLTIQLDDRGTLLDRWQTLLVEALKGRSNWPELTALLSEVQNWGGRAVPESVGYRLVRTFRSELVTRLYDAYLRDVPTIHPAADAGTPRRARSTQADEPVWRLLTERPPHLVPPGYADWRTVIDAALAALLSSINKEAGGKLAAFTWGSFNRADIRHPLSKFIPGLTFFLDAPKAPQFGDVYQPRVAAPEFGASVRFVVSPGVEASGIFHMPTGQSAHPLSPYYKAGHNDWAEGKPSGFLPGDTRWQLTFRPG